MAGTPQPPFWLRPRGYAFEATLVVGVDVVLRLRDRRIFVGKVQAVLPWGVALKPWGQTVSAADRHLGHRRRQRRTRAHPLRSQRSAEKAGQRLARMGAHQHLTGTGIVRTSRAVAADPRDERFELRLSAADRDMLRALADDAGEREAVVVRQLIRRAFNALEARSRKRVG